ncbi:hypothetical protein A0256_05600 [Mucilaginibacter sp. PAMC 26640]|nr:hypothetical protein A0256_05600 [Mucilaginibacter sp. PAMC 26640]
MDGLKKIIYNCRQATFLVDKKLAGKISFREQIELRIHLTGCDACKLYVKQSEKIGLMISRLLNGAASAATGLDDAFKNKLQLQIEDELNKN